MFEDSDIAASLADSVGEFDIEWEYAVRRSISDYYARERQRAKRKIPAVHPCPTCQKPVAPREAGTGVHRTYCSARCRIRAGIAAKRAKPPPRQCEGPECIATVTGYAQRKYCSRRCRERRQWCERS